MLKNSTSSNFPYSPKEEQINIYSHAFGLFASLVAFPFLVQKSQLYTGFWQQISFIIYGVSLIILYAASTFYHSAKNPKRRRKLNILDHAAIYVLIAGTYTPFTLITLKGDTGWTVFLLIWAFAIVGIILKLFFTGKFEKLSIAMYLLMGWQVVIVLNPLLENLQKEGVIWLFLGGVFYTIGAILYGLRKVSYNHAIFHFFVLFGSLSHFISIYYYI